MPFDIIGFFYVVILILFVFIGIKCGGFRALVVLIKTAISMAISTLISRPLALLFLNSGVGKNWALSIGKTLESTNEFFVQKYDPKMNEQAFDILKIPQNVRYLFSNLVGKDYIVTADASVGLIFGRAITYYSLIVIMFLITFFALIFVSLLLKNLFSSISDSKFGGKVDTIVGGAIFGFIGICLISVLSYFFSFLITLNNDFSSWLIVTMRLDSSFFSISKLIYNYNPLGYTIAFFQGVFNI